MIEPDDEEIEVILDQESELDWLQMLEDEEDQILESIGLMPKMVGVNPFDGEIPEEIEDG